MKASVNAPHPVSHPSEMVGKWIRLVVLNVLFCEGQAKFTVLKDQSSGKKVAILGLRLMPRLRSEAYARSLDLRHMPKV